MVCGEGKESWPTTAVGRVLRVILDAARNVGGGIDSPTRSGLSIFTGIFSRSFPLVSRSSSETNAQ